MADALAPVVEPLGRAFVKYDEASTVQKTKTVPKAIIAAYDILKPLHELHASLSFTRVAVQECIHKLYEKFKNIDKWRLNDADYEGWHLAMTRRIMNLCRATSQGVKKSRGSKKLPDWIAGLPWSQGGDSANEDESDEEADGDGDDSANEDEGDKEGDKEGEGDKKKDGAKKKANVLDTSLREMAKRKARLQQAISKADNIVVAITQNDAAWSWAANPQNLGKVQSALTATREKIAANQCSDLMLGEVPQLKKKFEGGHLVTMCKNFADMEAEIAALEKIVNTVWTRHQIQ